MRLTWLPNTTSGRMFGDYISTSFAGGLAFPAFVVAAQPSSGNDCAAAPTTCNVSLYTTASGLAP